MRFILFILLCFIFVTSTTLGDLYGQVLHIINRPVIAEEGSETYYLSFNAEKPADSLTADTLSGAGTVTGYLGGGGSISTTQSRDTYSFYQVNSADYLSWDALATLNTSECDSIVMWVYWTSPGTQANLFEITNDAGDFDGENVIRSTLETDGTIYLRHEGGNNIVSMTTSNTVSASTWTKIAFRWSVTGDQISVKVSTNDWENDADATTTTAMATAKPRFNLGGAAHNLGAGSIYIDDVVIYSN